MAAAAFFDWRSNSAVLEIAAEHVGVTGQTVKTASLKSTSTFAEMSNFHTLSYHSLLTHSFSRLTGLASQPCPFSARRVSASHTTNPGNCSDIYGRRKSASSESIPTCRQITSLNTSAQAAATPPRENPISRGIVIGFTAIPPIRLLLAMFLLALRMPRGKVLHMLTIPCQVNSCLPNSTSVRSNFPNQMRNNPAQTRMVCISATRRSILRHVRFSLHPPASNRSPLP